jgi:hypothetical protein
MNEEALAHLRAVAPNKERNLAVHKINTRL